MTYIRRGFFLSSSLFLATAGPLLLEAAALSSPTSSSINSPQIQVPSRGFSDVARKAIPAVVAIKVESETASSHKPHLPEPFNDDFFKHFFGNPMITPNPMPSVGFGSGVLISSDGYIVTNYHVVKGSSKIEVTLADDSLHPASLVGSDPDTDLAVIKIEGKALPYLSFADSDTLEIGEWVIAIGAPQSLRSTLTVGVVSAKGRSDLELNTIEEFIQSDVVINPGNSGGPLLNIEGNIVGINSALLSPNGAYIGISFAIPSHIVKLVTDQLMQSGAVKRGFMGITLKAVTAEIATAYNLEKTSGIVITDVKKGSAAERAGLRFADVILEVDGEEVKNAKHLYRLLWLKGPGNTVNLTLNREGHRLQVPVTLEEGSYGTISSQETFGLEFEATRNNLDPSVLTISAVEAKSAAERAGLRPGMKVLGINRRKTTSLDEAYSLLKEASAKGKVLLLVDTGRQSVFVLLEKN